MFTGKTGGITVNKTNSVNLKDVSLTAAEQDFTTTLQVQNSLFNEKICKMQTSTEELRNTTLSAALYLVKHCPSCSYFHLILISDNQAK